MHPIHLRHPPWPGRKFSSGNGEIFLIEGNIIYGPATIMTEKICYNTSCLHTFTGSTPVISTIKGILPMVRHWSKQPVLITSAT
ncbi:MAG: hypothetical protein ABRQ38_12820 [Candidatus Eremiobacterota bacterium]